MVAITIKQEEAEPAAHPGEPSFGLSEKANNLRPETVWARIEAYTAFRYTPRDVLWVVEAEGCEEWVPPLTPATINTTERWNDVVEAWETVTLATSPLDGFILDGAGLYRFTASVGAGDAPWAVLEAYRRLAEYIAHMPNDRPGLSQRSVNLGPVDISETMPPNRWARAMQHSGAADMLRPYRKVK